MRIRIILLKGVPCITVTIYRLRNTHHVLPSSDQTIYGVGDVGRTDRRNLPHFHRFFDYYHKRVIHYVPLNRQFLFHIV